MAVGGGSGGPVRGSGHLGFKNERKRRRRKKRRRRLTKKIDEEK